MNAVQRVIIAHVVFAVFLLLGASALIAERIVEDQREPLDKTPPLVCACGEDCGCCGDVRRTK